MWQLIEEYGAETVASGILESTKERIETVWNEEVVNGTARSRGEMAGRVVLVANEVVLSVKGLAEWLVKGKKVATKADDIITDVEKVEKAIEETQELSDDIKDASKVIDEVGDAVDDAKSVEKGVSGVGIENGFNSVEDIIKGVENGDIPLTNNIQKGNYGEMKMDTYFESQGYERISLNRVTDINTPTHQGIDGVYYNPDGHPPYIIGEAKYGSSKLSTLADGTPQMSMEWIEGGKGTPRLELSVGKDVADDILIEGYDSVLVNVDSEGNIITYMLDENGKIIK